MGTEQLSKKDIENHDSHFLNGDFDFYCVAHDSDYAPKYLQAIDEVCHDGMSEGYCSDYCNRCPKRCPVPLCNTEDDPYHVE